MLEKMQKTSEKYIMQKKLKNNDNLSLQDYRGPYREKDDRRN